jgi:hypothetical protein
MAKVAEGIARVASGIAMGRRQRSELAVEIKGLTRRRRGEVRSMLDNLRASRGRATREQAAEAKKVAMVRHGEVCSLLKGLKAARGKAMREYQRDSIAIIGKRRGDMRTLLTRFGREMMVRRQHRLDLSVEQREKAAAFMRDLTSGVAALRDTFAKEGRDRAAYISTDILPPMHWIAATRSPHGMEATKAPAQAIGPRRTPPQSKQNRLPRPTHRLLRILLPRNRRTRSPADAPSAICVNPARRDITEDIRNECCRACETLSSDR